MAVPLAITAMVVDLSPTRGNDFFVINRSGNNSQLKEEKEDTGITIYSGLYLIIQILPHILKALVVHGFQVNT